MPIHIRLDLGFKPMRITHDIKACNRPGLVQMDFLIEWNLRSAEMAAPAARHRADCVTPWEQASAGKCVAICEQPIAVDGIQRRVRRLLRLTERSIDKRGRAVIAPELTLNGQTTSQPI